MAAYRTTEIGGGAFTSLPKVPWDQRDPIPIWRGTLWGSKIYFKRIADEAKKFPDRTPQQTLDRFFEVPTKPKGYHHQRIPLMGFSIRHPDLLNARGSRERIRDWEEVEKLITFPNSTITADDFFPPVKTILPRDFNSKYQVMVVMGGIGAAFRTADHLSMESAVILQDYPYEEWFVAYMTSRPNTPANPGPFFRGPHKAQGVPPPADTPDGIFSPAPGSLERTGKQKTLGGWEELKKLITFPNSTITEDDFFPPVQKIPPRVFNSRYQVMVVMGGIGAAFRTADHLSMESAVILQDYPYEEWFVAYMTPYVNYIPLAMDLSNLSEILHWVRDNPQKVREIAINGRLFFERYLSYEKIEEFLYELVYRLSEAKIYKGIHLDTESLNLTAGVEM
eukprot:CAMPEP_0168310708 /NCGR_PEP_ID=MMETSP0142_2-20121227/66973_1 /TAXON_ID=44445 /ORGANISM="Pseudo-nitzschia australis, Strain 10249 10 AB" /LENGTH=392 /DNA_ID=CAMNT_0008263549 /DNA_START=1307 /DNA_END=2486 /DNA_ORIENTATION=-